jgi:hypothetical protein
VSTGNGMKLKLELARLGVRHGVAHRPVTIALSAPTDRPMVLSGFASTTDTTCKG